MVTLDSQCIQLMQKRKLLSKNDQIFGSGFLLLTIEGLSCILGSNKSKEEKSKLIESFRERLVGEKT